MRVLIVTNMYPTPTEPAFGSFVKDQADDLRSLGLDVEEVAFDGRARSTEYGRAVGVVRRTLSAGRFDIVHAHYGLSGAVAALARPRVPLVTTFHGDDYQGPAWQRWISIAVARRSAAIMVSERGRRRLFTRHAAVIPMGVDTKLFTPVEQADARRRLGWDEEGHYALLAGARRNPVKGAALFDAAVEHVPELRGVTLEGFSRADVAFALNAADVLVVASTREGSPVTVRESLACTTPVVAVPVGDVPTVLAGLPGCAVVARDPRVLADAIREALDAGRDPSLRQRAEETSREAVVRRVVGVYEGLL
ncbi:MAG TPA: glycosyltransferase [Gaiellaceae bacterium]|jgi:glycosyltransferase involved in cell wall biosynthesis